MNSIGSTIVVIAGVSTSGKTTVGKALASRLGAQFLDADDFHPPANVQKMANGEPLVDEPSLLDASSPR